MTYTIDELLTRSYADWLAAAGKLTFDTRLYIDGAFTDAASGDSFTSVSPRDGSVLGDVQAAGVEDVDRAVRSARAAFEDGRWRDLAPKERKGVLLRWAGLIRANAEELALLDTLEMASPSPSRCASTWTRPPRPSPGTPRPSTSRTTRWPRLPATRWR